MITDGKPEERILNIPGLRVIDAKIFTGSVEKL